MRETPSPKMFLPELLLSFVKLECFVISLVIWNGEIVHAPPRNYGMRYNFTL